MVSQIGEALQSNSVIITLNSVGWMAAGLEIIHYFGMFVLVGSIAMVDLRVIGIAGQQQSATKLAQRLFPWMSGRLGIKFSFGICHVRGHCRVISSRPNFSPENVGRSSGGGLSDHLSNGRCRRGTNRPQCL